MINNKNKGVITTTVLVFGAIFSFLLSGTLGMILLQHRNSLHKLAWNKSLEIAEAGINYSRWHIAHAPEDFDFSGVYNYKDPEGTVIGQYSLDIIASDSCDSAAKIRSTGWVLNYSEITRTVQVKYAKPALTKYSFLTNSNVWFGPEEELKGPFHSNGGIRMDGPQNSLSTSSKETYNCGPEHGCSPSEEKPGIWGEGDGQEVGLWEFPVAGVDFDSILQDLAILKSKAQSAGTYFGPSDTYGWWIEFLNDQTFNLYKVTGLKPDVWGYDGQEWLYESNDIETTAFQGNYPLSSECSPVFIEDDLWVNGDVNGRITLVAAKLPEAPSSMKKIIINGNINYVGQDSVLGLLAQKDILIPLYSPDNLEIKAGLLAQKGHIFRYYYPNWRQEPYRTYAIREYIETYGSLITNTMWTFTWVDSSMNVVSGYEETEISYNPDLIYSPPPHFPSLGEYEIMAWDEL